MKVRVTGDYYEDSYLSTKEVMQYLRAALKLCHLTTKDVKDVEYDTQYDDIIITFTNDEKVDIAVNDFDDPEFVAYIIKDDTSLYKNLIAGHALSGLCDIGINWKMHADASVPPFDEEMINVYEFNHDEYESLRPKSVDIEVMPGKNALYVDWMTQEEVYGIAGMKRELKRAFSYKAEELGISEQFMVKVHVYDRDGYDETNFSFKVN
jgi:hypothetical protein